MVDPKRHINILSPEEQSFLEECETAFAHRFTDLDAEFMAHCQRPANPPPIVHPWNVRRGGGGGTSWRGGYGGDRRGGWGRGGNSQPRYRPYNRGYRRNNYRDGENYHSGRDQHTSHSNSRPNYRSENRQYERESNH